MSDELTKEELMQSARTNLDKFGKELRAIADYVEGTADSYHELAAIAATLAEIEDQVALLLMAGIHAEHKMRPGCHILVQRRLERFVERMENLHGEGEQSTFTLDEILEGLHKEDT